MCLLYVDTVYEIYLTYDVQDSFTSFTVLTHIRHTQNFKNYEFWVFDVPFGCKYFLWKKSIIWWLFDLLCELLVSTYKSTSYSIFKDLEKIKKIAFSEGIFFLKFWWMCQMYAKKYKLFLRQLTHILSK